MASQARKAAVSFDKLPFDELVTLREQLDDVIAERLNAEEKVLHDRLALLERLRRAPSVSQFERSASNKSRVNLAAGAALQQGTRKLPIRYRNPDNPSQIWAGRGLQPRWLRDALRSGVDISHFIVADLE